MKRNGFWAAPSSPLLGAPLVPTCTSSLSERTRHTTNGSAAATWRASHPDFSASSLATTSPQGLVVSICGLFRVFFFVFRRFLLLLFYFLIRDIAILRLRVDIFIAVVFCLVIIASDIFLCFL